MSIYKSNFKSTFLIRLLRETFYDAHSFILEFSKHSLPTSWTHESALLLRPGNDP
ncbi:hypothetical protein LEP1GSC060_1746 [Leptospira weilii serovar Ranarum str. ICFT]|uniref:Uncharacterized protein n=1 Tax=Leptospira weilii serovar Ranarum str. ICFT TaxID=1218598 RepID=N1WLF9_9LEPT|nr:hypothetical protein LEP1GSC060_1746 [Leptospira weilii serovar Ranarum str. ICFT]